MMLIELSILLGDGESRLVGEKIDFLAADFTSSHMQSELEIID